MFYICVTIRVSVMNKLEKGHSKEHIESIALPLLGKEAIPSATTSSFCCCPKWSVFQIRCCRHDVAAM